MRVLEEAAANKHTPLCSLQHGISHNRLVTTNTFAQVPRSVTVVNSSMPRGSRNRTSNPFTRPPYGVPLGRGRHLAEAAEAAEGESPRSAVSAVLIDDYASAWTHVRISMVCDRPRLTSVSVPACFPPTFLWYVKGILLGMELPLLVRLVR